MIIFRNRTCGDFFWRERKCFLKADNSMSLTAVFEVFRQALVILCQSKCCETHEVNNLHASETFSKLFVARLKQVAFLNSFDMMYRMIFI